MTKTIKIVLVVGVSILVYIILFFWAVPTFIIVNCNVSRKGQQVGNGDHCDYVAAILVKTDLMKDTLQQYYAGSYKGLSQIQLIWLGERNVYTTSSIEAGTIASLKQWINRKGTGDGTAVIYIFQPGLTSAFDYRCS
jgi:hypothetical protein